MPRLNFGPTVTLVLSNRPNVGPINRELQRYKVAQFNPFVWIMMRLWFPQESLGLAEQSSAGHSNRPSGVIRF